MRKDKVKSALFSAALWVVFFVLVVWMLGESRHLAAAYNSISLRYDLPVTYNEVVGARRYSGENADRDAFWPTFWGESTADFESEYHTAEGIRKIDYDGDGALVWPATFIHGTYPSELDQDGCAISSKLAWRLWGADNVVASSVKIGGRLYTVRGVFEGDDEMALVAWGDRENMMGWTGIELAGGIENAGRSDALEYIADAGLPQPVTILNAPAISAMSGLAAALPVGISTVLGCAVLAGILAGKTKVRRELFLFLFLLLFALLLPTLLSQMPVWLIPTRWSNLSFWQATGEMMGTRLQEWFLMRPYLIDALAKTAILKQAALLLCAMVLVPALWHRSRPVKAGSVLTEYGPAVPDEHPALLETESG